MKKTKTVLPSTYLKATSVTAAVLTALYGAPAHADADSDIGISEVTVTATRRVTTAQDIPLSITAVSGAALEKEGIQDIAGLAHSMAGVNFTDKGPFGGINGSTLIIRGLNSEATAGQLALASPVIPPVATYVDDTPLFVNLRLQDLDHVEILRGPQGTLYGSGSLGGTIRFVQNAPDPSAFDAKVEAGLSKTDHTHALNEDITGVLNLPITETFAIRLNAGWTDDAGFINQPNLYQLDGSGVPLSSQPLTPANPVGVDPAIAPAKWSKYGVNTYEYRNVRLAALWKPNDDFKAQLSYYYQRAAAGGFPYVATQSAAYNQWISPNTQLPGTNLIPQLYNSPVPAGVDRLSSATNSLEGTSDSVNLVALEADYDLGFATLTSSSSWARHDNATDTDLTALYTNFYFYQNFYGQNPRSFIQGHDRFDDKVWSQEFRLASKSGGTFDWVAGVFYKDQKTFIQEHEYYPGYDGFYANCPQTVPSDLGAVNGSTCGLGEYIDTGATSVAGIPLVRDQAYIGDFETRFKDLAVFGELTWHVTSAWSVTGGTRAFKQTVNQAQQTGLLFDGPGFAANEALSDEFRRALWKVNTAYQLDKTDLVYATWSQGFRRGGVNALPPTEPVGYTDQNGVFHDHYVLPAALNHLAPDKVDNYEVGAKGTLAGRFSYSVAVYDMEWHNVQEGVQLTPLVLPAALNIGDAQSRGVEMEFNASITRHLGAQLSYTYDQTKLKSISPLFSYPNTSVPAPALGSPMPGTPKNSVALGVEYGHIRIADGELEFAANANYRSVIIPALSATVPHVPGYTMVDSRVTFTRTHWLASLYVNNITNNLGINSYTDPAIYGNRFQAVVSQPRTVGITVGYSFKER
ncbi:MAG: TonB-dependent receptor [Gammaproteobacteria bacterium]|nr:TonB-dependent receptor [Gammaproteobacteria bacterium]